MKRIPNAVRNRQGFTLMEVIVTIIAAGILAAFFVHFMGTSLSSATDSVTRVQAESGGAATVERIIADYVLAMNAGNPTNALGAISSSIGSNSYDDAVSQITVTRNYIEFDAGGNEVDRGLTATNTLKVTVGVQGNNHIFLLGQARTTGTQPLIHY